MLNYKIVFFKNKVQCIKNYFGGNTGCLVVPPLDEGTMEGLETNILSKPQLKFQKLNTLRDNL